MSWDLQSTARPCGHQQRLERYTLDVFDFRTLHYALDPTLNMRAPITNSSQVQIWLAGVLVPPTQYSIVPDPDRIQTGYTFSKILFNSQVRLIRPLIEVNYVTKQGFCLQCCGNGSVTDWTINTGGGLIRVRNVQKLAQQCLKYILTSKNPFSPALICQVKNYVGQKFGLSFTTTDVASTIQTALQNYMQIQASQKTVQTLSSLETLKDIVSVMAQQDDENPLVVYVSVVVAAYGSTNPIPLNIALQSPN